MAVSTGAVSRGRAGERAARIGRSLSRAFRAARPYVIGLHGIRSLLAGSWVLMCRIARWVRVGGFIEVFAPARAKRRKEAQQLEKKQAAAPAPGARRGKKARRDAERPAAARRQDQAQEGDDWEPPGWLLRSGGLLFMAYLVVYLTWSVLVWSMSAVGVCWCVLAWMCSPPMAVSPRGAPSNTVPPEAESVVNESSGEQLPLTAEQIADRFRLCVEHAVAARWAENIRGRRQGVHVEDLLAELRASGQISSPRWDTEALAGYLRALGIPVRDPLSLTVNGKKFNRVGIHHDDLAKHLGRFPRLPPHSVPDLTPTDEEFERPAGPPPAPGPHDREEVLQTT
ncbi:hypothetical protein [Kitasatospora sp. NPDC088548]|uniref:hypothetical protein n=1 Tax=Kitasatospora sp. NPDC088548 TaxID=3364075 RepID=UPI00380E4901